MATSVTLPALGESVTEGTVTRWLKQPGDQVAVDEPLLEVSTDKVDTEIPSPIAGTLLEIKVAEDETVEIGTELAVVGAPNEATPNVSQPNGTDQAETTPATETTAPQSAPPAETHTAQNSPAGSSGQPAEPAQPQAEPAQPQAEPSEPRPSDGGAQGASITLPALGESVTEGTVTRWLKQPGDQVAVDEPLLEVSTDKVDTEIPSPIAGTLLEIKVAEDETVEIGTELATIGTDTDATAAASAGPAAGQQAAASTTAQAPVEAEAQATTTPPPPPRTDQPDHARQSTSERPEPAVNTPATPAAEPRPSGPSGNGKPYVTPLVRKLAAEHGVNLESVNGTGIGGRIRKQDVLAAAETAKAAPTTAATSSTASAAPETAQPSPLRGTTEKLTRMRKVIAKRVHEALQQTAQLTTVIEVDVTTLARLRDRVKNDFARREGVKLSFLPFFAKAAVEALKQHPKINASIDVDKAEVTYHDRENLVIAVDTEQGLLVPVIKDAGDLNIAGLARKIAEVADKARTNKLTPDEITGGTFTLTNTGSRGALFDTPIFFQPQVAILGTGAVVKRPMVIDDPNLGETIAVRHMIYLALSYDHRLIDGADAARFLTSVKQRLEAGQFESDLGF
jgi:2-oxoglutarate dehydrogenase E2 component (dihydrolipoamide succinyltransferase)